MSVQNRPGKAGLVWLARKVQAGKKLARTVSFQKSKNPKWLATGIIATVSICAILTGCSSSKRPETSYSKRVVPLGQPVPKGGGRYKVGKPYRIAGEWYYPKEDRNYDRQGIASWYGTEFHGRYTSNGEVFDMDALTAAHPTLPMPVYAKVTNLRNRRSIVVRINDRGPYKHNRIIDLSRRSAKLLGFKNQGTAHVRVQYLGRAPINGDDRYERHYLAQQPWVRNRYAGAGKEALYVGAVARTSSANARLPEPRNRPLYVQAGAFSDRNNAERLQDRLSWLGRTYIEPTNTVRGTLFKVRLGPFHEPQNASNILEKVIASGAPGAVITKR